MVEIVDEAAALRHENALLRDENVRLRLDNARLRKLIKQNMKAMRETLESLEDVAGVTLLDSEIDWLARNRRFNGNRAVNRYARAEGIESMNRVLEKQSYSSFYTLKEEFATDANYQAIAERRQQLNLLP
jgi:hypothetical protein